MKKLINRPENVVPEMIEGLVALYPGVARLPGRMVLVRSDIASVSDHEVAVISGGGSGHEPAHGGYVGAGMLSAAVAGDVFTSPAPDAVLAAIRAATGPPGVLLIVKNYTGDRLNFGLAAELARADGLKVEMVVVADDVALAKATDEAHTGRRGLAGTVLVEKVAGAAAAAGRDLYEVASEARAAAESVATMGVALTSCIVPEAGKPGFVLGDQEVELGLGIHGEPGVRRVPLASADALVNELIDSIASEFQLSSADRVALLVNGLGGTPAMELAIVARHAISRLESKGIVVERVYAGTFLSALEMAGVSLSVLRVDDQRISRLDASTNAPAWPNSAAVSRPRTNRHVALPEKKANVAPVVQDLTGSAPLTAVGQRVEAALSAAIHALVEAAPLLTDLDQAVGDGDLGISLKRGAQAIKNVMTTLPLNDPAAMLHALGLSLQATLGGTSGPLYAVFFLRAAGRLRTVPVAAQTEPKLWLEALRSGCDGIIELGGAGRGDRTMLDALLPALDALTDAIAAGRSTSTALGAAANAADAGAKATAELIPRRGRSSYLGKRAIGHPDPGAQAVAVLFRAVAKALG